jgi:hypothetical protein
VAQIPPTPTQEVDMQLVISQRDAKIAGSLNVRTEYHGSDAVRAMDIGITGLRIGPDEFCALLNDPDAHNLLFKPRQSSELHDPQFPQFAPFRLVETIEAARVVLFVSVDLQRVELGLCKLKSIVLTLEGGGMTEVAFTVQSTPVIDSRIVQLLERLDTPLQIEISYQHNPKQASMDLGSEAVRAAGAAQESGAKPRRNRKGATPTPPASGRPGETFN